MYTAIVTHTGGIDHAVVLHSHSISKRCPPKRIRLFELLEPSPLVFFKNKGGNSYCDLGLTRRFVFGLHLRKDQRSSALGLNFAARARPRIAGPRAAWPTLGAPTNNGRVGQRCVCVGG